MIDFIETVIMNSEDYAELLGDMYEPVCACLVVGFNLIGFGAVCTAFTTLLKSMFGGNR